MFLFGERLGPRFIAGVLLAFSGLWLILGADWATLPAQYRWGVWMGLGAGVCYAAYNVGIKRSQAEAGVGRARVPVEQVLCIAAFGSALCLGLIGWSEGEAFRPPSLHAWGVLPVALAGLLLLAQPIMAYLLDVALFDVPVSPRQWLGLAVSLAGIFVAGMRARVPVVAQDA
jgi:drug/metabolite transporter (DMT)-like permease